MPQDTHGATDDQPQWRLIVLSCAKFIAYGQKRFHEMSHGYPQYDAEKQKNFSTSSGGRRPVYLGTPDCRGILALEERHARDVRISL